MQFVLAQVDKDTRHPLLLEQPSLQAAISSWCTDFELQEIFRKGKTQFSPFFYVDFLNFLHVFSGVFCLNSVSHVMFLFCAPAQINSTGIGKNLTSFEMLKPGICHQLQLQKKKKDIKHCNCENKKNKVPKYLPPVVSLFGVDCNR